MNHAMILPGPVTQDNVEVGTKNEFMIKLKNILMHHLQDLYEARGDKKLNIKCKPDILLLRFNYFPPCFQIRQICLDARTCY